MLWRGVLLTERKKVLSEVSVSEQRFPTRGVRGAIITKYSQSLHEPINEMVVVCYKEFPWAFNNLCQSQNNHSVDLNLPAKMRKWLKCSVPLDTRGGERTQKPNLNQGSTVKTREYGCLQTHHTLSTCFCGKVLINN